MIYQDNSLIVCSICGRKLLNNFIHYTVHWVIPLSDFYKTICRYHDSKEILDFLKTEELRFQIKKEEIQNGVIV